MLWAYTQSYLFPMSLEKRWNYGANVFLLVPHKYYTDTKHMLMAGVNATHISSRRPEKRLITNMDW